MRRAGACSRSIPPRVILNGVHRHPECHPEREPRLSFSSKHFSPRSFATLEDDRRKMRCEESWRGGVEVLQSEMSASGQGVKQNRKRDVWKREAGSAMGLLNVYSAFELFLMRVNPQLPSLTAHNRMQLLQAACQKPAQIPPAAVLLRCISQPYAAKYPLCKTSTAQKSQSRSFATPPPVILERSEESWRELARG